MIRKDRNLVCLFFLICVLFLTSLFIATANDAFAGKEEHPIVKYEIAEKHGYPEATAPRYSYLTPQVQPAAESEEEAMTQSLTLVIASGIMVAALIGAMVSVYLRDRERQLEPTGKSSEALLRAAMLLLFGIMSIITTFCLITEDVSASITIYSDSFDYASTAEVESNGGWTIVDGGQSGPTSPWHTWNLQTTHRGTEHTLDDTSPFMAVDSDRAGSYNLDESLITPAIDTRGAEGLTLSFDYAYKGYSAPNEQGDVDYSIDGGNTWTNLVVFTTPRTQVTYADILAPTPTGSVDYEQLELYWSMFGLKLNEDEYVTVADLMSVIPEIGGVVRYDPVTDSYVNMTGTDQITQGMGLWVYCMSDVTLAMNYAFVVQKI